MTPNPAKKSFEERYAELMERKSEEFGKSRVERVRATAIAGFSIGATDPDLLRAVRLDERAKTFRTMRDAIMEFGVELLDFEGSLKDMEAELEALLSGGGENGIS